MFGIPAKKSRDRLDNGLLIDVTAIEHPWFEGLPIVRQQSKPLTLRAGEKAVLDFGLGEPAVSPSDPYS